MARAPPNPGQRGDLLLRGLDGGRRMGLKMGFQGGRVGLQGAFRPMELDHLQPLETARCVQPEIRPQGVLRNPRQLRNLPVR